MDQTDGARIAVLDNRVGTVEDKLDAIAADVRAIRDVMLTETGARKGRWMALTVAGSTAVGFAAFWHDILEAGRKFFG